MFTLPALLVRLSTAVATGDARPLPATRGRLEEALDAVTVTLQEPPHDSSEWVSRLGALKARAQTVLDIARALVDEDPEGAQTDVLVWAEALCATVESHVRDLEMPDTLIRRLTILARGALAMAGAMANVGRHAGSDVTTA